MPISQDLFLAILSMDAYNRGYGAGVSDGGTGDTDGLGETGSIGGAVIDRTSAVLVDENGERLDIDAGFYAVAYERNGEIVISYRGTDASVH